MHVCVRQHIGCPTHPSLLAVQTTKTVSLVAAIALGACNHVSLPPLLNTRNVHTVQAGMFLLPAPVVLVCCALAQQDPLLP